MVEVSTMQFNAKARYIRYSPYKLRPLVDVIRGKNVQDALGWLATYASKRAVPVEKIVQSAAANAKQLQSLELADLVIKEVRVDEGPMLRYFKPGAMGRSNIYRKRLSHMQITLEPITKEKD